MKMSSDHAVMETVLPNDNYCSLSRPTPLLSRHTTELKLQNMHKQSFNYSRKANSSCSELVGQLPTEFVPTHCGAWGLIGRFVSFRPKAGGFESGSSRQVVGQVLHSQFHMALRREAPIHYPYLVGSAS